MELEAEGFTPIEIIGRGGSATVYRAREDAFDREVALKVFDLEFGDAEQERFTRELRAVGRLGEVHHAVALVFATGVTRRNNPFLAMRYYPGGSLQADVKRHGPVALADALAVADCIGGALDAAHAAGILHRDVKPANVLLDGKQLAVLADFGIASFVEAAGDTSTSMSMMTPAYAAPERINGEPATTASDIYSLAATLWSALAGRVPHASTTGDSVATVIHRIIQGEIQPLDRTDLPPHIEPALRRALHSDPGKRPTCAAELLSDLAGDDRGFTDGFSPSGLIGGVPLAAASLPHAPPSPFDPPPDPVVDDDVTRARQASVADPVEMPVDPSFAGVWPAARNDVDETTMSRGSAPPEPAPATPPAVPPTTSNLRSVLAVAAGLLLLLVVAGVVLLARDGSDDVVAVKGASVTRSTTTTDQTTTSSTETTIPSSSVPDTSAPVDTSTVTPPSGASGGSGITTQPIGRKKPATTSGGPTPPVSVATAGPTQPVVPMTPPPVTVPNAVVATASSIVCTEGGGAVTLSPGLTTSRSPQTMTTVADRFGLSGCSVYPSQTSMNGSFDVSSITFASMDCIISGTSGSGKGRIRWSDGNFSDVTIRMSLSGTLFEPTTGTVMFTVDDGLLKNASGSARVSRVDLANRELGCNPAVVRSTLHFETLTLKL
jgi:serine/threonine protein kinase